MEKKAEVEKRGLRREVRGGQERLGWRREAEKKGWGEEDKLMWRIEAKVKNVKKRG